jgi:tyrosinase
MFDEFLLNRRHLLANVGALGLVIATGGCERILKDFANRPTRRNIANLAPNDPILQTYRDAITQMRALPTADPRNWTNQASIHFNKCSHQNWWLLPWHRIYLVWFEGICRKLTGNTTFALPYWNWTNNPAVPDVFYASGDVLNDVTKLLPQGTPIAPEFVSHAVLEPILQETNFQIFGSAKVVNQRDRSAAGPLEAAPHNHVHTTIGGNMGTFMSPLDPIFWTHHSMLDFCWVDWNIDRKNDNPNDPAWGNLQFKDFVDADGNPTVDQAGLSVLLPLVAYQYEPSQIGATVAQMPFVRSQAELDHLKAVVQQGGNAEIPLRERYHLDQAVQVDLGHAGTGDINVNAAVLQQALGGAGEGDRLLLTLGQVELPASADFFVRVFVNAPGPVSAETPITDPHYAGSFAFFLDRNAPHGGMQMGRAGFMVDVTDALRRGAINDRMNVQLVAVPYAGRPVTSPGFSVGSLELAVARIGIKHAD